MSSPIYPEPAQSASHASTRFAQQDTQRPLTSEVKFFDWQKGKPRRRYGFTIVELIVVMVVISLLIALLLPAVHQARQAAQRIQCKNNLKQIGLALHCYESNHGCLPPARMGSPGAFSSLAILLPYLDNANLYNNIDFNKAPTFREPPVTPLTGNTIAAMTKVKAFICPSDLGFVAGITYAASNYVACNGSGGTADTRYARLGDGVMIDAKLKGPSRLRDITDGLSSTVAYSEQILGSGNPISDNSTASNPYGNTLIDPLRQMLVLPRGQYDTLMGTDPSPTNCVTSSSTLSTGNRGAKWMDGDFGNTIYNHGHCPNSTRLDCTNTSRNAGLMSARSRHFGGVHILLCDGSTRFLNNIVDPVTWRSLATKANGELLSDF